VVAAHRDVGRRQETVEEAGVGDRRALTLAWPLRSAPRGLALVDDGEIEIPSCDYLDEEER
jgi:hypothetical protein